MTLDEIKQRLAVEKRLYAAISKKIPRGILDAEKLIEWLDRAMTFVIDKTQSSSYRGAAARELLREIKGEKP